MTPASHEPPRWQLVAGFAAIYLIWGSTYLGVLFAIATIPPVLMAGLRFTLAGTALYLWARSRGAPSPGREAWKAAALLGFLFFTLSSGLVSWVETRVSSGLTALGVALVPLWTVLLDWGRPGGERPSARTGLGLLLGFSGVALLVAPGQIAGGEHMDPLGFLALLVATVSWAGGSVLSRRIRLPADTVLASGMQLLAGGAVLLGASLPTGEWARWDPAATSLRSVLALLYLIGAGSIVAFSAYSFLLRVRTPAQVSTAGYVNPVVAILLGWALAGEAVTPRTLLAGGMIVAGVAAIITGHRAPLGARRTSQTLRPAPDLTPGAERA